MNQAPEPRPLSLGFIGGSLRSAVGYAHFVSCRMDRKWSVDAGCFSTNAQINEETARAYGVSPGRVYHNWKDLIGCEKGRIDAVLILSPTPLHGEMTIACLEAGIPVICEKALAAHSEEAKRILDVRDAHNGFLAVTYNYSGYPMLRELRHLIETGRLGRIIHFQAEMPQEGFIRVDARGNRPTPQRWRLSDGRIPTIYLDLAVHLHQLIYHLIRETPLEVVADQASDGWFHEIVDNVTCLARYSNKIQAQFWLSKSALGHRNGLRLRIYGSAGAAEWYQANPEELTLSFADGRREILDRASSVSVANLLRYNRFKSGHPAGFLEAFANLYGDIAESLLQYRATGSWNSTEVYGGDLAYDGLRFLEAVCKSAGTGAWCKVADQRND